MIDKKRLTEKFCQLVAIDSPSFSEREMADELTRTLSELGFSVQEDKAGDYYGGNSGNIYGFLPGTIEGPPLLFSAHMDTVEPAKGKKAVVEEGGKITSQGDTVLGADDLSGIVCILEAITVIKEQDLPHRSIEVLFPIAEEVYIRGSEVFDYSIIKSKEAYVLDLSGPVGTAALKAPTLLSFEAKIFGKASHAGFSPESGIHAIAAAADFITKIRQGRIDDNTTVNMGLIEGGTARNIVPDLCILKGEVRSLDHRKASDEIQRIESILKETVTSYGADCKFETSLGCLAYNIDPNHPVVRQFKEVCQELGYETSFIDTFGGSDNNNFVRNGITGIVIASGMNQVHSCQEYTHVDELFRCSGIMIKLMTREVLL